MCIPTCIRVHTYRSCVPWRGRVCIGLQRLVGIPNPQVSCILCSRACAVRSRILLDSFICSTYTHTHTNTHTRTHTHTHTHTHTRKLLNPPKLAGGDTMSTRINGTVSKRETDCLDYERETVWIDRADL